MAKVQSRRKGLPWKQASRRRLARSVVGQHDHDLVGVDVDDGLAAARVDDHVDLALIHRDRDAADRRRVVAELFEPVLHVARSLARAGKIVSGD